MNNAPLSQHASQEEAVNPLRDLSLIEQSLSDSDLRVLIAYLENEPNEEGEFTGGYLETEGNALWSPVSKKLYEWTNLGDFFVEQKIKHENDLKAVMAQGSKNN